MIKPSLFSKVFPPPQYLAMPVTGLDISDQSVKCAEVVLDRGDIVVRKLGEQDIPTGVIEGGQIKNPAELTNSLRLLKEKYQLENVAVSLPEEQAYVVRIKLPAIQLSEIRSTIELQLEEHIPFAAPDAVFDYEIISDYDAKEGFEVAVSVLPRGMVSSYTTAIREAGLSPLVMEIEAEALARNLISWGDKSTHLIADIGKTRTGFSIVTQGKVAYTTTLNNIGGEDITKNVQKSLKVSYEEAERLKIEKGLNRSQAHQELFFALVPAVASLRDEILKVVSFWETHKDESGVLHRKIEGVILCGGQATLPGLTNYIASGLSVPVELGNPWINILSTTETIPPLDLNQALRYSTALGLSLRNLKHVE